MAMIRAGAADGMCHPVGASDAGRVWQPEVLRRRPAHTGRQGHEEQNEE